MRRARLFNRSARRATRTTFSPRAAKRVANSSPRPELAPVMSAVEVMPANVGSVSIVVNANIA
jgi:hypothetical protein